MAVSFFLEKRANKAGELPIRAQINIKGITYISTIGISVNPACWNGSRVSRSNSKNSKRQTGAEINQLLNNIENHFLEWERTLDWKPARDEIKAQLDRVLCRRDGDSFFARLSEFVEEQSDIQQWADSTLLNWRAFRHHMEQFKKDVTFGFFDESGLNAFVTYLRTKKHLEENSVRKQYKALAWFMNWALRKGYTTQDTITRYRPKFKVLDKPIIFLTKEELHTLYHFQVPPTGARVRLTDMKGKAYEKRVEASRELELTRDLFCFCAFTSLRYSDMANLRKRDVAEDYIYVTTQKTNDRLPIDLNPYSKAILEKYRGQGPGDYAFPKLNNVRMNQYLKILCELCGFSDPVTRVCFRGGRRVEETFPKWKLMSTHAGRRTFICLALSSGIPPQVVMKWTGHSDYKAMRPYIDITGRAKSEAMDVFASSLEL